MTEPLYQVHCIHCGRRFFVSYRQWDCLRQTGGRVEQDAPAGILTLVLPGPGCFVCAGAASSLAPADERSRAIVPLVVPAADAPAAVRQLFALAVPGSVHALYSRDDKPWLYYEGDVRGRDPQREPTLAERVEYALAASGRAHQNYPTSAKVALPSLVGVAAIGYVAWDQDVQGQATGHWVWWEEETLPLVPPDCSWVTFSSAGADVAEQLRLLRGAKVASMLAHQSSPPWDPAIVRLLQEPPHIPISLPGSQSSTPIPGLDDEAAQSLRSVLRVLPALPNVDPETTSENAAVVTALAFLLQQVQAGNSAARAFLLRLPTLLVSDDPSATFLRAVALLLPQE